MLTSKQLGLTNTGHGSSSSNVSDDTVVGQHDRDTMRHSLANRRIHQRRVMVRHNDAIHVLVNGILTLSMLSRVVRLSSTLRLRTVNFGQLAAKCFSFRLSARVQNAPETAIITMGDDCKPVRTLTRCGRTRN